MLSPEGCFEGSCLVPETTRTHCARPKTESGYSVDTSLTIGGPSSIFMTKVDDLIEQAERRFVIVDNVKQRANEVLRSYTMSKSKARATPSLVAAALYISLNSTYPRPMKEICACIPGSSMSETKAKFKELKRNHVDSKNVTVKCTSRNVMDYIARICSRVECSRKDMISCKKHAEVFVERKLFEDTDPIIVATAMVLHFIDSPDKHDIVSMMNASPRSIKMVLEKCGLI